MYIAIMTRPDISFTVSILVRLISLSIMFVQKVLKNSKRIKNWCLKYINGVTHLEDFVNADWGSIKQKTVSAEYIILAEASIESIVLI